MTAPLEPIPSLILSWLLSHRGWQLLMGTGCPQGESSFGEEHGARGREVAPHPGPSPFPVRDLDVPLHRDTKAAFGVTQLSKWGLKTPREKGFFFVAKTSSRPFCPLLCPPPQAGGDVPLSGTNGTRCLGHIVWDKPLPKFGVSNTGYVSRAIQYGITSSIAGVPGDTWGFSLLATVTLSGRDNPPCLPRLNFTLIGGEGWGRGQQAPQTLQRPDPVKEILWGFNSWGCGGIKGFLQRKKKKAFFAFFWSISTWGGQCLLSPSGDGHQLGEGTVIPHIPWSCLWGAAGQDAARPGCSGTRAASCRALGMILGPEGDCYIVGGYR